MQALERTFPFRLSRCKTTALLLFGSLAAGFVCPWASAQTTVYVDQALGINADTQDGSATEPFKSITYALLVANAESFSEPWTIRIAPGTYDNDPVKPVSEREIFPIQLHDGMHIEGLGTGIVALSGEYNAGADVPLLKADNDTNLLIEGVTFRDMVRAESLSHGGGIEWIDSTGSIRKCTFVSNAARYGGGIWASLPGEGALIVEQCIFYDNAAYYDRSHSSGGAIHIDSAFRGSIRGNTFTSNSTSNDDPGLYSSDGGAIFIYAEIDGDISANLFSRNSASRRGGGIYLLSAGLDTIEALIQNNFFIEDRIGSSSTGDGASLHTYRDVTLLNNTFCGHESENLIAFLNTDASVIQNNIFHDARSAITEGFQELSLTVTHNSFSDVENVRYRGSTGLGNDPAFVDLQLSGMSDSVATAPGFIGLGLTSGTFSSVGAYDAALNETTIPCGVVSWDEDEWAGAFVNLGSAANQLHFVIAGNTSNELKVRGNIAPTGLTDTGNTYTIDDFRLDDSSGNLDVGASLAVSEDFEGDYRPQNGAHDIGADERVVPCTTGPSHSADLDVDGAIGQSELLRVVQFHNAGGHGCGIGTEDGFDPNALAQDCCPHDSDYAPQDWVIQLAELLRLAQFYKTDGYTYCPVGATEDGYCLATTKSDSAPVRASAKGATEVDSYIAGGTALVEIPLEVSSSEVLALGVALSVPDDWTFNALDSGATNVLTMPDVGEGGTLEFNWQQIPTFPTNLRIVLDVPPSASGEQTLDLTTLYREDGAELSLSDNLTLADASVLPLEITQQPVGATKTVGESHTFSVAVSGGSGNYAYDWRRDGISLGVPSSPDLVLNPLSFADAGNYRCVVADTVETQLTPVESNEATLDVVMSTIHSADANGDQVIGLSELLRVIQFANAGGYSCVGGGTEDGYAPGLGDTNCEPHSSDYAPQDWSIGLSELLRALQIFNVGSYQACGETEDGFCLGGSKTTKGGEVTLGATLDGDGYTPGATTEVTVTIDRTDGGGASDSDVTALGLELTLPTGWALATDAGANCDALVVETQGGAPIDTGTNAPVNFIRSQERYTDSPSNSTCEDVPSTGNTLAMYWLGTQSNDPQPLQFPLELTMTLHVPAVSQGSQLLECVLRYRVNNGTEDSNAGNPASISLDEGSGAQTVTSSTHPDATYWYVSSVFEATWEDYFPAGNGYLWLLDQQPFSNVDLGNGTFTESRSVSVPDIPMGTSYFHVVAVDDLSAPLPETIIHFQFNYAGPPTVSSVSHPDPDLAGTYRGLRGTGGL